MLRTILTFVQHRTSHLTVFGLLAASALMMFLMNGTELPFSTPTIEEHSGDLTILDTRGSFTPEDAYELFAALGREGRQAYLILHLGPDMIFPIGKACVTAGHLLLFFLKSQNLSQLKGEMGIKSNLVLQTLKLF